MLGACMNESACVHSILLSSNIRNTRFDASRVASEFKACHDPEAYTGLQGCLGGRPTMHRRAVGQASSLRERRDIASGCTRSLLGHFAVTLQGQACLSKLMGHMPRMFRDYST